MKSPANIFDDLVYHFQPHEYTPRSWRDLHDYEWWTRHPNQHPDVIQVAQKRDDHLSPVGPHQTTASREEVLNYLGQLADDYRVPRRVVYALAEAESHIDPDIDPQPNYEKKHGKFVLDKQGNKKVVSWDYGLLQINGGTVGKKVKDPTGHVFHIEPTVKDKANWKAKCVCGSRHLCRRLPSRAA